MHLTKEQIRVHGANILAWANGAEIEHQETSGTWRYTENPEWVSTTNYRVKPQPTYQERQAQWVKETGIKVGDSVRIVRGFKNREDGFKCSMGSIPRENIGKTGYVEHLGELSIFVNQHGDTWEWPYFCLEPVKEPTYRPYTMAEAEQHLLGAKVRRKDNGRACLCNLDSSLQNYLDNYTYLDGTPCGMQESP